MEKKVKTACGPSVNKVTKNLDEESAAENLNEESADGGSTSPNLHVNQEMSPNLMERGKSPLARSIRTSDKDEHIELNETQYGRQL